MAPKNTHTEEFIKEVATELGIENWKGLSTSAQNLNKAEEAICDTLKAAAYDRALSNGDDEATAKAASNEVFKKEVYKLKMMKANQARIKKLGKSDIKAPSNAASSSAPVIGPNSSVATAEPEEAGHLAYLEAISHAINRVLQCKHFAGIETTEPNPIQAEDAGDSGVQDPFDDDKCTMALEREKLYRAGCNFFWIDQLRTLTPGVPLNLDRIMEMSSLLYAKPRPFIDKVHVEGKADGTSPRTSKLLMLMPEETAHAYLLAINRDIERNASEETILQWKKHCLSVCFEYHDTSAGGDGSYWKAWNLRESVAIMNNAVMRTARQRACEIFQFKKRIVKSGSVSNPSADAISEMYKNNIITKDVIDAKTVQQALVVYEKICKYPEITAVIDRLERKYGIKSCLNSMSKLAKIGERIDNHVERKLMFHAIEDSIARGSPNSKFTRDFLVQPAGAGHISFVQVTLFKWKVRHHLLTIEGPREKLSAKDLEKIAEATSSYDSYKAHVDNEVRDADRSWIGAMAPSSAMALRVIQVVDPSCC